MKKRAVSYLRAARIEMGDFDSLVRQKAVIEAYCSNNDIELVNVFWDVASGSNFNRKGWKELEVYLSNHPGYAQLLISADPSRIGRNFALFIMEEKRFKEQYNITFLCAAGRSEFQELLSEKVS